MRCLSEIRLLSQTVSLGHIHKVVTVRQADLEESPQPLMMIGRG